MINVPLFIILMWNVLYSLVKLCSSPSSRIGSYSEGFLDSHLPSNTATCICSYSFFLLLLHWRKYSSPYISQTTSQVFWIQFLSTFSGTDSHLLTVRVGLQGIFFLSWRKLSADSSHKTSFVEGQTMIWVLTNSSRIQLDFLFEAFFVLATRHLESDFLDHRWYPCPLQGKHTALTTGPPGNFPLEAFLD